MRAFLSKLAMLLGRDPRLLIGLGLAVTGIVVSLAIAEPDALPVIWAFGAVLLVGATLAVARLCSASEVTVTVPRITCITTRLPKPCAPTA